MNIKIGDILKSKDGSITRKVIEILTQSVLLSYSSNHDKATIWFTFTEIEENFELPKEKWKPKNSEKYYYIVTMEIQYQEWYESAFDQRQFEVHNCFRTRELAEAKLEKIIAVLAEN